MRRRTRFSIAGLAVSAALSLPAVPVDGADRAQGARVRVGPVAASDYGLVEEKTFASTSTESKQSLANDSLPALTGLSTRAGSITLPPASMGFLLIGGAPNPACH